MFNIFAFGANAVIVASILTFMFGLVIGSFLNVCIYRIPLGQNIAVERSHCMKCGHVLQWYELIPLFSWIIQGGKCRKCKDKISIQYPLIELGNALAWEAILFTSGFRWVTLVYFFTASCMIVIAVIDERTQTINIFLNIFIAVMGVIGLALDYTNWYYYVIGMFAVSLFFLIIVIVSKEKAMGLGDVYLMAAAGLLLGWKHILFAMFIGALLGSIIHLCRIKFSKKEHKLAFGPYLCAGIFITMMFGNQMIDLYEKYIIR